MVVHSISVTATPPRPSSTLAFRMKQHKGGAGVSSARRALSALGNNNAQINLRMAESLLTITQDKFMKKWNFDPVKETPLTPGRFQWASVGAKFDSSLKPQEHTFMSNRGISTCFTLPRQDIPNRVPEPHDSIASTNEASASENQTLTTDCKDSRKRPFSHLDESLHLPNCKKRLLLAN